jgi:hypothetical protein
MKFSMMHALIPVLAMLLSGHARAQDAGPGAALQKLVGVWDVYLEGNKDIIATFSASPLGKTQALQTRMVLPAMSTEVHGTWVYDSEIKALSLFEVTSNGLVRHYRGEFRQGDVIYLEGFSKQKPGEVTERSSLTWLAPDSVKVWSNDLVSKMEATMIMVRRK